MGASFVDVGVRGLGVRGVGVRGVVAILLGYALTGCAHAAPGSARRDRRPRSEPRTTLVPTVGIGPSPASTTVLPGGREVPRASAPTFVPNGDVAFFSGHVPEADRMNLVGTYGEPLETKLYAHIDEELGKGFDQAVTSATRERLPTLRPRILEAVEETAAAVDRRLNLACDAVASARSAGYDTDALERTTALWEELRRSYDEARPRAFAAVDVACLPSVVPTDLAASAYRWVRAVTPSIQSERLLLDAARRWIDARAGTLLNVAVQPIVDDALDAAKNREILVISKCAPRIEPKPPKPAKAVVPAAEAAP